MTHEVPCVALAADERYALPLAVAVRSISEHLDDEGAALRVYVLEVGLTETTRSKLLSSWPASVEAHFIAVDPGRLEALPLSRGLNVAHVSRTTYARLLVPDLVPESCRKVLYLDADVLVLGDVRDLWNASLGEYPVAAVQDGYIKIVGSPSGLRDYEELGLQPNTKYFNAGVLLMDLDAWRAEDLGHRILDHIANGRGDISLNDQDALNAVLAGRWKPLDASWNVLVFGGNVIGKEGFAPSGVPVPLPGARLLHFISVQKPWKRGYLHPGYQKLYRSYQLRTAWGEQ